MDSCYAPFAPVALRSLWKRQYYCGVTRHLFSKKWEHFFMHIADGVLTAPTLITGGALALTGIWYGLRKLAPEKMMSVAILTAAFFVVTLIHLPGDIHLVLNGLLGVVLGWAAFPAVAVALLLQCVLFQFGGLTSLGVNICIAGFPAVLCGALFRRFFACQGHMVMAFLCGLSSIILSALTASLFLISSGPMFWGAASALLIGHIPIMLLEGLVTAFIYTRVIQIVPELFASS